MQPEYAWLAEIGITAETDGVFDGKWSAGKGESFTPISPFTGEPIATVKMATDEQYDATVDVSNDLLRGWPSIIRGLSTNFIEMIIQLYIVRKAVYLFYKNLSIFGKSKHDL